MGSMIKPDMKSVVWLVAGVVVALKVLPKVRG
jgi:hypothetical protein